MPTPLPSIFALPTLPPPQRLEILDLLFEPSPPLHTLTSDILSQSHSSYSALIASVKTLLTDLHASSSAPDIATLDAILCSHPRLGAKKVDSEQSRAEQASLGGGEREAQLLSGLNEEYEATFPGLRYVVFVNGRSRGVVMEDMRRRIDRRDLDAERREGIDAMHHIAKDRAAKLAAM